MSTRIQAPKAPSRWRRWRTARPFWGGLLVILSGTEILLAVKAPLPVVLHVGMQGMVGYLVPVVLLLCGILLLANPAQRLFYSTVAAVLALASWATSNLGGFMLGLLLGLVGSALAFAWTPDKRKKPARRQARPTTPPAPPEPPAEWATLVASPASAESARHAAPDESGGWPKATAWDETAASPAPATPPDTSRDAGPDTTTEGPARSG